MTDPVVTETIELDDLTPPEPEQPEKPYRSLLEVWRALLEPARNGGLRAERVTPQWATRMVSTYQELRYADTPAVSARFYDLVDDFGRILDEVIAADPTVLDVTSAQEDATENQALYLRLLIDWQAHLLTLELGWDPTQEDAPVVLAAMSEAHSMFFGQNGLTGHLDSIGFQFTEDDRMRLQTALEDVRSTVLEASDGR